MQTFYHQCDDVYLNDENVRSFSTVVGDFRYKTIEYFDKSFKLRTEKNTIRYRIIDMRGKI